MANLNLSQFTEKTLVADADWVFVWDTAGAISKKVSRNSLLSGTTADFHLGLADAAAPVAQTLSVQSVVAGTSNTAGVNFSINGSQGTGTGAGGSLLFRTAPAGSSGTTQNALGTALAITAAGNVGIGTTAPRTLLHLNLTGGAPAIELSGATIPNFTGVGFVPNIGLDTIGRINQNSVANAGLAITGFSANSNTVPAIGFYGHLGPTSPTQPAIAFSSFKHNGTTGRTDLAATEISSQWLNGSTPLMTLLGGGNVGIGTTAPSSNLTVAQGTAGVGTISVGAAGTTITGVGTQFLNTFAVGQTITSAGQTLTISTIASDTSMTISPAAGAAISGQAYTLVGGTRFTVAGNGKVGIGANVFLERDGDNQLALRNGGAAQAFAIYNTYTNAGNFEIGYLSWGSNVLNVGVHATGSGSFRKLAFIGNGIDFVQANFGARWSINTSGHLLAAADNTYDIGASGASRPRNVYVGSSIQCGTSSFLGWAGRAKIYSPSGSNNVIQLLNNAENDFNLLILGLATSAFPAIKRSTTYLQARLADDSAFAPIQGKLTTDTAYTGTTVVPTGFITLYDSTGTAYKVPCVAA
jgi:hypothetical protein